MIAPPHAAAARGGGFWSKLPESWRAAIVLTLLALATRAWIFGNPAIHVDDQFYLLVGQRLAEGYLPYVDIWDRKPVGLFLIYAFANRVFADPVAGYQLIAAVCVVLTSLILFAMARRVTGFAAALGGAAAYPAWLLLFGGIGGQSPVFYNLPMAAAAAWTMALAVRPDARRLTAQGCAIMLLAGLAMQIKYAAVFEGLFFGLSLLWTGRQRGRALPRLAADAAVWIAIALAPTLAAYAAYAAMGHGEAFIDANFLSIFRDEMPFLPALVRLLWELLGLSPFWVCAWIGWRRCKAKPVARWIFAWAGASIAGFLLFGNWFDHYVLPLLAPLSLIAALAFDSVTRRRAAIGLVVGLGLAAGYPRGIVDVAGLGDRDRMDRLAGLIQPHLGKGCLYVADDLSILYYLTRSCLPSRFAFPDHLALKRYDRALGIDQRAEVARVLASRPPAIVVWTNPGPETGYAYRALLEAALRAHYRPVGTQQIGTDVFTVFARAAR